VEKIDQRVLGDVPRETWTLNDYAKVVSDFLGKVGIDDVEVVIGHSNGGAIALYACAHHMLTPKKLVLLASSGVRNKQKAKKQTLKYLTKLGKVVISPLPKSMRDTLRRRYYGSLGSDALVAPHLRKTFEQVVSYDIRHDASTLTVPTLLIYGTKDTATPVEDGRAIQQSINESQIKIVEHAGHFLHHETPDKIAAYIKGFIDD
jgi:pimeloyl-ACP methyl ester carboxylesterase